MFEYPSTKEFLSSLFIREISRDYSNYTMVIEIGSSTRKAGKFCNHQFDKYHFYRICLVNFPPFQR